MAAGFAEVTGKPTSEPATTEPAAKPAKEAVTTQPAKPAEPAKPAQPAPAAAPAGVTAADLHALRSEIAGIKAGVKDTVNGVLGNWLEKNKATTTQPAAAAPAAASKPTGKLTVAGLKRMSENFPDIAESLLEDLKEIAIDHPGLPEADLNRLLDERVAKAVTQVKADSEAAITAAVQRQVPQRDQKKAEAYLSRIDPKWKEDINTPEFGAWLATLDEYERDEINESPDPRFVRTTLKDFRKWRDAQPKKGVKSTSQQRLEAALTPESSGGQGGASEPSEDEAMAIGFKEVRQGK